jgi:hypothetical protein
MNGKIEFRDKTIAEGQNRLPVYLETTNARNLAFYEKLGFEVSAHAPVPKGGPPMWAMVRPAAL